MQTRIQQQIAETVSQIVHLERVEQQLSVTKEELEQAYEEQSRLMHQLGDELKDIERLEGLSTRAIFHKILGNKEQQLEKERQEYLELSLKEEDLGKSIELLEYESDLLSSKLDSKEDLHKKLENLKHSREQEIIQSDPVLRRKLMDISEKLENTYRMNAEIDEALEVGKVCQHLLKQVVNQLAQVRNWGSWQGGRKGGMSQMMRRQAIDRARNLAYQVRHHLNLFDKELADTGQQMNFSVDTSKFSNFSDFFFNNIITDWVFHQEMTTAIGSAKTLYTNVSNILQRLQQQRTEGNQYVQQLSSDRDDLLTA